MVTSSEVAFNKSEKDATDETIVGLTYLRITNGETPKKVYYTRRRAQGL